MFDHYYLLFTKWVGAAGLSLLLILALEWLWNKTYERLLLLFGVKLHLHFYLVYRRQIEKAIDADTALLDKWMEWQRMWRAKHS